MSLFEGRILASNSASARRDAKPLPPLSISWPTRLLIGLLMLYRYGLSPFLHGIAGPFFGCRFQPTCSAYACECLRRHGFWRGLFWSLQRLCRCHPWSPGGFDPVPVGRKTDLYSSLQHPFSNG